MSIWLFFVVLVAFVMAQESAAFYNIAPTVPPQNNTPKTSPAATSAGPVSVNIGSTVRTTDALRVRLIPSASGKILGTQAKGATGTIVAGPTKASGYTWWKVQYDTGPSGWSVGSYLQVAQSSVLNNKTSPGTASSPSSKLSKCKPPKCTPPKVAPELQTTVAHLDPRGVPAALLK